MIWLYGTAILLIVFYTIKAIHLYQHQGDHLYHPSNEIRGNPADVGLDFQDVELRTADNILLHGWYCAKTGSKKVILLFHGNTGNISDCLASLKIFSDLGYSSLVFDYRGYGRSQGKPDELGTYRDADTAWEWLLREQHFAPSDVIILGRSLGAAIGANLASKHNPAAVVLESTFTSLPDIAAEKHRLVPARLMTRFNYNTLDLIKQINSPILIIHGPDDSVISYKHGRRLFAAANEPKGFLDIDSHHAEGYLRSGEIYINGLKDFFQHHIENEASS